MNKNQSILGYYSAGFTLANKSLEIYLISLFILLPTSLNFLFPNSPYSAVLTLVSLLATIINIGFSLSIPVFLIQKQQNQPLTFQNIVSTTIQSTKRMILPALLIFILLVALLMLFVILLITFFHPTAGQVQQFFQSWGNLSKGWQPIFLIQSIIVSFLVFTSFLFSLESQGLFSSLKNSIIISIKNLPYLVGLIILGIISYSLTSFLPVTEFWGLFLRFAVSLYIGLMITANTLFYYQDVVKTKYGELK